jgi:hypothetical protein
MLGWPGRRRSPAVGRQLLNREQRQHRPAQLEGGKIVVIGHLWPAKLAIKLAHRRQVADPKREQIGERNTLIHTSSKSTLARDRGLEEIGQP